MDDSRFGFFKVLEDNSRQFLFSSGAGEFKIDGTDSTIHINSFKNNGTILLDEILRLEYGTMTRQLPPNSWLKLWLLHLGGLILMDLLGDNREEEKWFQVSAVLRSGERIPLYFSKHSTNIRDTQLDVVDKLQSGFDKHGRGRILEISTANRVVEDEFPKLSETSQSPPKLQIDTHELIRWVTYNSAGTILAGIFTLGIGTGLMVASFQWLILRQQLSRMQGLFWIVTGLISSGLTIATIGLFSLFMFAESLSKGDRLTSIVLLIAGHLFYLSLCQVFIWPFLISGSYKMAVTWGFANSVVIVLAFLGSRLPISIMETNTVLAIACGIILVILTFLPSGYLIAQTFGIKKKAGHL